MKKLICTLIAAAVLAMTCFALTGCGEDKKDTKETVASTQATTQSETDLPTKAPDTQAPATEAVTDVPAAEVPETDAPEDQDLGYEVPAVEEDEEPAAEEDPLLSGGITREEAEQYAMEELGDGYTITKTEKSEFIEKECWMVTAVGPNGALRVLYVDSEGVFGEAV